MAKNQNDNEKDTQQPKKLTYKQKLANEKALVKAGHIVPRYNKRSPLGRIFLLILVFFFGMFTAIGGFIGLFVYLGTRPLKEGLDLFGVKYDTYITEEAADKSALDVVNLAKDLNQFNNLEAVSKYTPLVDQMLQSIMPFMNDLGVTLDTEELRVVPFSDIGTYFTDTVLQSIAIGDAVHLKPGDNGLLIALCYGEEGVDYDIVETIDGEGTATTSFKMREGHSALTVGDVMHAQTDTLLAKITIEAALNVNASSASPMRYLAYGSLGVHYEIEDGEIVMLTDPETNEPYKKTTLNALMTGSDDIIKNARICDLLDTTDATGMLKAIENYTIDDLTKDETLKSLKLNELIDLSTATGIMKTIADKDWTIGDLTNADNIRKLTIGEIIGESDEGFLGALSDWTIDDLGNSYRIERIKISQMLDIGDGATSFMKKIADMHFSELMSEDLFDMMFLSDIITIDKNSPETPAIMVALADRHLGNLAGAINELRLTDFLGEISKDSLLYNLKNSTLETLAADVQSLTVVDVFGNDVYSFITVVNGETYADIVNEYETTHREYSTRGSKLKERLINVSSNEVYSYYILKGDGSATPTRYQFGYFEQSDSVYHLVGADKSIYTESDGYYYFENIPITPVYTWYSVDYEAKQLIPLPAGDGIGANYGTLTLGSPTDEKYERYEKDGAPLYYLSTDVYFDLYADNYSIFYINADGERVDLDDVLTAYDADGQELEYAGGKVTYGDEYYFVRKNEAGTYISVKRPVFARYFAEEKTEYTALDFVNESDLEMRWYILSGENEVRVDRFLDCVWYLLFGGEEEDGEGNLIVIDNTNAKITELADYMKDISSELNETPLYKLYLHGVLTANPYAQISAPYNAFTPHDNLNEMSLQETLDLLISILGSTH